MLFDELSVLQMELSFLLHLQRVCCYGFDASRCPLVMRPPFDCDRSCPDVCYTDHRDGVSKAINMGHTSRRAAATAPTGFFAFRVSRTVAGAGLWSGGLPVSGQQRPDLRGALRAPRAGSHTGRVTRFGFEVERWSRMWGFMGQNESTGKFTAGSSLCFPFSGCDLGYLVPIMGFWRLRNHFGASEMV